MPAYSIHPTIRLALWVAIVLFVQALSGADLLLAFVALPIVGRRALRRGGRLIWRTRWLMLSLVLVFSWGVAGTPLWDLGIAPTREGVEEGVTQLGRLALVLITVATFLEYGSVTDLLAATHAFLKPFRYLGLNPERGVVRLMLVLRAVETMPRPRDWRVLLEASESGAGEHIVVSAQRFSAIDYVIALAMLISALFSSYFFLV